MCAEEPPRPVSRGMLGPSGKGRHLFRSWENGPGNGANPIRFPSLGGGMGETPAVPVFRFAGGCELPGTPPRPKFLLLLLLLSFLLFSLSLSFLMFLLFLLSLLFSLFFWLLLYLLPPPFKDGGLEASL